MSVVRYYRCKRCHRPAFTSYLTGCGLGPCPMELHPPETPLLSSWSLALITVLVVIVTFAFV